MKTKLFRIISAFVVIAMMLTLSGCFGQNNPIITFPEKPANCIEITYTNYYTSTDSSNINYITSTSTNVEISLTLAKGYTLGTFAINVNGVKINLIVEDDQAEELTYYGSFMPSSAANIITYSGAFALDSGEETRTIITIPEKPANCSDITYSNVESSNNVNYVNSLDEEIEVSFTLDKGYTLGTFAITANGNKVNLTVENEESEQLTYKGSFAPQTTENIITYSGEFELEVTTPVTITFPEDPENCLEISYTNFYTITDTNSEFYNVSYIESLGENVEVLITLNKGYGLGSFVLNANGTKVDLTVENVLDEELKYKGSFKPSSTSNVITYSGEFELIYFDAPEDGYDGSAVTITFWHTMGYNLRAVLDDAIEEFNQLYPNITIDHDQIGGYDEVRDQITTSLAEHKQPNIAYCYPEHVALYNKLNAVVGLDWLIESTIPDTVARTNGGAENAIIGLTEEQKADFIEGFYNEGKQFETDAMYTIPFSKSTEVMYYNKTIFEKHNLVVPTTWDEMEAVCTALKAIYPNSTPLGYDSSSNWFINMCEQLGSPYTSASSNNHFLFNNDINKAFVYRFANWYKLGYVTTQELYGSYTSGLFVSSKDDVDTTGSFMSIGTSAGAIHQRPLRGTDGTYPFEVGITSIPQVDPNNPKVITQGPSVCIFKDENPQEVLASWLFVKYLATSAEFQAAFAYASGYMPVIKSAYDVVSYKQRIDEARLAINTSNTANNYIIESIAALVSMEQSNAYFSTPAFIGASTARDEVRTIIDSAMASTINSGTTESSIKARIEELFTRAIAECEYQANN